MPSSDVDTAAEAGPSGAVILLTDAASSLAPGDAVHSDYDSADSIKIIEVPKRKPVVIVLSDSDEEVTTVSTTQKSKKGTGKGKHSRNHTLTKDDEIKERLQSKNLFGVKKEGTTSQNGSADATCAVCLGEYEDRTFCDECFHSFCFACILQWSKVVKTCPLCKSSFKSLIHKVTPNLTFQMHEFGHEDYQATLQEMYASARANVLSDTVASYGTRFRYRSTMSGTGGGRFGQLAAENVSSYNRAAAAARREHHRIQDSRAAAAEDRRRSVYSQNMKLKKLEQRGRPRIRDVSVNFFRNNPAVRHRIVPWMLRDLRILLGGHQLHVSFVMKYILNLLDRIDITSREFRQQLRQFLFDKAGMFADELYNFACSPYDVQAYDDNAVYERFESENGRGSSSSQLSPWFPATSPVVVNAGPSEAILHPPAAGSYGNPDTSVSNMDLYPFGSTLQSVSSDNNTDSAHDSSTDVVRPVELITSGSSMSPTRQSDQAGHRSSSRSSSNEKQRKEQREDQLRRDDGTAGTGATIDDDTVDGCSSRMSVSRWDRGDKSKMNEVKRHRRLKIEGEENDQDRGRRLQSRMSHSRSRDGSPNGKMRRHHDARGDSNSHFRKLDRDRSTHRRRDYSRDRGYDSSRDRKRHYPRNCVGESSRDRTRKHSRDLSRNCSEDGSTHRKRDHSRDHQRERSRDLSRNCSEDRSTHRKRDRSRDRQREYSRDLSRNCSEDRSTRRKRDHSRVLDRASSRDRYQDFWKDPNQESSRDHTPDYSRDSSRKCDGDQPMHRKQDHSRDHAGDSSINRYQECSRDNPTDLSSVCSRDRDGDRSTNLYQAPSSDHSDYRDPSLYHNGDESRHAGRVDPTSRYRDYMSDRDNCTDHDHHPRDIDEDDQDNIRNRCCQTSATDWSDSSDTNLPVEDTTSHVIHQCIRSIRNQADTASCNDRSHLELLPPEQQPIPDRQCYMLSETQSNENGPGSFTRPTLHVVCNFSPVQNDASRPGVHSRLGVHTRLGVHSRIAVADSESAAQVLKRVAGSDLLSEKKKTKVKRKGWK